MYESSVALRKKALKKYWERNLEGCVRVIALPQFKATTSHHIGNETSGICGE